MERLRTWFYKSIQRTTNTFKRYLWNEIAWNDRLIIIVGARGVGKTTLMLQYIKESLPLNEESLYASLDDLYFSKHNLIEFVEEFHQQGGQYLFLDEVQKYKNWATEIKNIYDNYPELKIVLSGSSAIALLHSEADLSRRATYYHLHGMSFREYLNFTGSHAFDSISMTQILNNHLDLSLELSQQIMPLKAFQHYQHYGYYPFFKEGEHSYHKKLAQTINTVLEVDIPQVFSIEVNAIYNIKKLLGIIAELVPFKPNVKKLSEQIGITRDTLIRYLQYLEKANIINLLYHQNKGISLLNKPEKIYLNNPNISFALSHEVNVGNLRESFFMNQLQHSHELKYSGEGDFKVDNKYTFEIGGKSKTNKQIAEIPDSLIASDNLTISSGNKIPLWLFGFTY